MKSRAMIIIVCSCLLLSGCGKTSVTAASQTETENYEGYSGLWTESSFSHDKNIPYGGLEFSFQVTDNNNLDGYVFMQQGTSERIAEIDNVTGKITNGELNYKYTDDGWGGSGILHITFSNDDTIQIEVQDYKIKDTNLSGYGFSGEYQLQRSKPNKEGDREKSSENTDNQTSEPDLFDVMYEKYYAH